jgi:hypothetical protein
MLLISKTIEPKKKELLKKYAKEIAANDAYTVGLIENELLEKLREFSKMILLWISMTLVQ